MTEKNTNPHFLYGNIHVDTKNSSLLILDIEKIKGLCGRIEMPLENGVFGLTGNNGTGKSTIMATLSKLVPPYTFRLTSNDYDNNSSISYQVYNINNHWSFASGKSVRTDNRKSIRFYGRYEGSLFYGKRFEDSRIVDSLIEKKHITSDLLVDADDYITKSLGEILHNDKTYYRDIKRMKNKETSKQLRVKNLPYFYEINGKLISQYRMSSGECLLLSLLHFLNNAIIRKTIPSNSHILLLIDEIEVALHPVAVRRLISVLNELTNRSTNLTCLVSSHSIEVIRNISPNNLFNLSIRDNGSSSGNRLFIADNPIYPCYLMKDLYVHDGYDFVILVEDVLASKVVETSLAKLNLRQNRLINVVPAGGWTNIFDLHKAFVSENTLGLNTKIVSIIDGDVEIEASKKFKNLSHIFLPIPSIEKFLLQHIIDTENDTVKKKIKDDVFVGSVSLEEFVLAYKSVEEAKKKADSTYEGDRNGKRLYRRFKNFCESERKISEDKLIDIIFHIIEENINLSDFEESLKNKLK